MKTTARTAIALLIAAVYLSPPVSAELADGITVGDHIVHGADERALHLIGQADSAFRAAGLDVPGLTIYVHSGFQDCLDRGGLFNRDGSGVRIDLCSGLQFTVLHEVAHAWEFHTVDELTRTAFLDMNSLVSWRGNNVPWGERGMEIAAETIALGLLDRPFPDWQLGEAAALDGGYSLLTGTRSPRFAEAVDGLLAVGPQQMRPPFERAGIRSR
ncbi:MAG: hypothetical protein U9N84_12120 [Actinomycetota bacterium]|nr:hypothetical protein [Actinomycetota bacterium]